MNEEILRTRVLRKSAFLKREAVCYYVLDYLRYGEPDNPNFILTLKNTYNSESDADLDQAKERVKEILVRWIPEVMEKAGLSSCTMICVPRAKSFSSYTRKQMYLIVGVSEAGQMLHSRHVLDGTGAIARTVDTRTTHLKETSERVTADGSREENTGREPYPGITRETCSINAPYIRGKNIILVDDIYTGGVNIDEDCIQALYDAGAANVVLFTLSCTVPRKENK